MSVRMSDRTFRALISDEPFCKALYTALTGDTSPTTVGTAAAACEIDRRVKASARPSEMSVATKG